MKAFSIIIIVIGIFTLAGCTAQNPSQTDTPQKDRTAETADEPGAHLSQDEAYEIAAGSSCTDEGNVLHDGYYNDTTKTWWLKTDIDKPGCNPHCVVWEETGEAEINWMCTGLLPQ